MTSTQPSVTVLRIIVTVFAGVAQITTAFRLTYRVRLHRFWLDDAWAAISLICSFLLLVCLWIRTDVPGLGPLNQPHHARVVAYWIVSLSFTCVLWSARMSILFSVIRIIPPMTLLRRLAYFLVALFSAMWIGLLLQKINLCVRDNSWVRLASPQCRLTDDVAITELITDILSDFILVVLPIRLLWDTSLPVRQRQLLLVIFSASIFTTIVSIVHAVYLFGPGGLLEALTANVEGAVSLIVANLAVVVTYLYRLIRNGDDLDGSPYQDSFDSSPGTTFKIFGRKHVRPQVTSLQFASMGTSRTVNDNTGGDAGGPIRGHSMYSHKSQTEDNDSQAFDTLIAGWEADDNGLRAHIPVSQETIADGRFYDG